MPTTVFKVVIRRSALHWHPQSSELWSASADGYHYWEKTRLIYKPGEKTIPKIGGIFCFESVETAERFIYRHFTPGTIIELWEAETEEPLPMPKVLPYWGNRFLETLERFWKAPESWQEPLASPPVAGTVLCADLKLLKRLSVWEGGGSGARQVSETEVEGWEQQRLAEVQRRARKNKRKKRRSK